MFRRIILCAALLCVINTPDPVLGAPSVDLTRAQTEQVQRATQGIPSDKTKRCPQWEQAFRLHGLPVEVFSYIAWRESRCRAEAVNAKFDRNGRITWTLNKDGSYDSGLLQINSTWKTVTANVCGTRRGDMRALLKANCNLKVARYLFDNGGLRHWGFK